MTERILNAFNGWFASAAGVLQTLLLVLGVVIFEAFFPHSDQHGFLLLYWLTVYSAVTQPALAFIARKSGDDQGASEARQEAILGHLREAAERHETILGHLEAIADHLDDDSSPTDRDAGSGC